MEFPFLRVVVVNVVDYVYNLISSGGFYTDF